MFFAVIFFFGQSKDRTHSFILFISGIALINLPEYTSALGTIDYKNQFITNKSLSIAVGTIVCLVFSITSVFTVDSKAWMQALLYSVILFIDIYLFMGQELELSPINLLIYKSIAIRYNELIIIISLAQIAVSFDSFIAALSRQQRNIYRLRCYIQRIFSSSESYNKNSRIAQEAHVYKKNNISMHLLEEIE